jgi:hypothetical protein
MDAFALRRMGDPTTGPLPVGLQVVAVALEVQAAQLGVGLAEQVAFAEQHLVVLCR